MDSKTDDNSFSNAGHRTFNKTKYRPWKPELTGEVVTVEYTEEYGNTTNKNRDKHSMAEQDYKPIPSELSDTLSALAQELELGSKLNLDQIFTENLETTAEVKEKELMQVSNSSISFGGFLKSSNFGFTGEKKIPETPQELIVDLTNKEKEINYLTKKLEYQRLLEESEQSLIAKNTAEQAKRLAEIRTDKAIEQANLAQNQLRSYVDKIRELEQVKESEIEKRRYAEKIAEQINAKKEEAQILLQKEVMMRKDLEADLSEQVLKMDQIKASYSELSKLNNELERKNFEQVDKINELNEAREINNIEKEKLKEENKDLKQQLSGLLESLHRSEAIIASEKQLRKIAEQKVDHIMLAKEEAERGRQEEARQRKLQRKLFMNMLEDEDQVGLKEND